MRNPDTSHSETDTSNTPAYGLGSHANGAKAGPAASESGFSGVNADPALQRWEQWLKQVFPRACFQRADLTAAAAESEEVVWQVQVRTGRHGRVHIAADALRLDPDAFAEVTRALDASDWFGLVDQFVRVRIDGSGTVGRLNQAR